LTPSQPRRSSDTSLLRGVPQVCYKTSVRCSCAFMSAIINTYKPMNNSTTTAATAITRRFSEFSAGLKYEDLPPDVFVAAKNGVLDFIGVALIGSREESTGILRQTVAGADRRGASSVFGTTLMTSEAKAALINAYGAHVHDYDDVQPLVGGHMSGAVLGATLALAESHHLSGKALIAAYVAGFEVGCRLGAVRKFGFHLREHGVHPTGFLCHFGATTGAAQVLQLDVMQTRRALGIAAGHASGLMRSFGTMCKGQNAGNSGHNAVLAAQLSKNGFVGPEDIFDGEHNIFSVQGAEGDEVELMRDLGQSYHITRNTFKICACAGWRNPIIEAVAALAKVNKLKPENIEAIEIKVCREVFGLPNYTEPTTGLQAKFSVQYAAAVALVDHCGHVTQFSDERVADPVLQQLATRVTYEPDDSFELNQVHAFIRTSDGRQLSHSIPIPKGDPRNPLGWDELFGKFRANASLTLSQRRINQLGSMIRELENIDDIAALARLCRSTKAAAAGV
jgi:2-methylcitrate dehydratase PrpD